MSGMTEDDLERMLGGSPVGPDVPPRLERILAAARAPAHAGDLAGEDAAVAAFRAAVVTRTTPARVTRAAPVRRFVTRLAAVKVAAVAAVLAAGGLAVAAATGTIDPSGLLDDQPPATTPATTTAGPSGGGSTAPPRPSASPAGSPSASVRAPGGGLTPAAVADLCRDYLALPPGQARKLLAGPPYDALAEAAGGEDEVDGFCAALAPAPSGQPGKPSKSPKAKQTPKPPQDTGRPTDAGKGEPR